MTLRKDATLCLTCKSTTCPRNHGCELLTIGDDGTVSITLAHKLTPEMVRRIRQTGDMLAVASAQPTWLAAAALGTETGGRLDSEDEDGLFEFVEKTHALSGHKLATAIYRSAIDELYGRFNVLDWQMGLTTIDEYIFAIGKQRPSRLSADTRRLWNEITSRLKKGSKLAALAATTGRMNTVQEMMQQLRHAFRAALLLEMSDVDRVLRATRALSKEEAKSYLHGQVTKDIRELDAEIRAAAAA